MGSTTLSPRLADEVDAFTDGRGFAVLDELRLLRVAGADARRWLGDLITTDVAGLSAGGARRSLVLTPTGRIRADVLVLADDDGFVLAQDARAGEWIGDVLVPYVLSSAVTLADVGAERTVLTDGPGRYRCVGLGDLRAAEEQLQAEGRVRVGAGALEVVRVRRGAPRLGVDVAAGDLAVGSRLDDAIDATKGCFLGQEAVAKIRDLGHPPTVLLHLRAADAVAPGTSVHTPGGAAGVVTSAVPSPAGDTIALARVDWGAAEAALTTADRIPLVRIED